MYINSLKWWNIKKFIETSSLPSLFTGVYRYIYVRKGLVCQIRFMLNINRVNVILKKIMEKCQRVKIGEIAIVTQF